MPTIEELFKSRKLVNGQTAEQKYDVRNSKELEIQTSAAGLGLSFKAVNVARRNLGARKKETKLEEEVTGLRLISNLSSPLIYGTDIIKFTTKTTSVLDDMKAGANGSAPVPGLINNLLKKGKESGLNILGKLGATLPQKLIPSRIVLNDDFKRPGGEYNTMVTLNNLKSQSGGNAFGRFIESNLKGRPTANQLIGSALELGKKKLNNLLLGSPSQEAARFAKAGGTIYDSLSAYGKVMTGAQYLPEDLIDIRNDLSTKYNQYAEPTVPKIPLSNHIGVPNVLKNKKTKFSSNTNDSIEVLRGITNGSDYLNTMVAYNSNDGLTPTTPSKDNKTLEGYDFIPLKFWSVARKQAINFRAVISGLSETLSPSWDTNRFVGNPFSFYTYNGIERGVTFEFKIYSLNEVEHVAAWQRVSFLTSLVYPQGYVNNVAVTPPFLKFTLGNMYNNKECFIESLTYTIDDNTPWEIGLDAYAKDWKLPKIINVGITLKLVETVGSTYQLQVNETDKKGKLVTKTLTNSKGKTYQVPVVKTPAAPKALYGFGNISSAKPILNDVKLNKEKKLFADGSPKPDEATSPLAENVSSKKDENPITKSNKATRKVAPNKEIENKLISSGTIRAGSMINYRGNPIYSYKNKWYYSDGTETTAYGDVGVKY